MTVLLIGGDGQVGWFLRHSLARLGPMVVATRAGNGEDLSCDLTDVESVRRLVRSTRPSLIVNAAAYTAVDAAETDLAAAEALNGRLPALLGEEARRRDAAVIHYSTDYVFPGGDSAPRKETDPTGPANVYGRTKLAGEQGLAASGAAHLTLRTAWVYSRRGRNFLTTMLRLARERHELRVVADQHGSPTSAPLVAEATAAIASAWKGSDDPRQGIFHLTASGGTTWHGFASRIVERGVACGLLANSVPVVPVASAAFPTPARRPTWSLLDNARIQSTFAVTLPDWRDDLERVMSALGR
ncbi:dTDP-4-dehydrorhamnose reductase [Luteibacter sp. UNC138MFCol5.1]|uniref:dTDP-4-dehydrorhamnose reductase n=1 Tax=Luteibacter sp. UNC138MFCol5.1 TaxID=1502774 RepID=UPI0008ABCBF2|nr:dTDP-4-dehydrorhamnose reductase [Luteibacter sp. UNC138MFCol5.1]SEP05820.1 dTDP-4-dehydrorhamnose reductase [Luteibacter sp. UNC138MFCol5.1]